MRHSSGFYSAELGLHDLHPTLPFYASRRVCGDRNKSADASDALKKAPLVDLLGHQRPLGVFLWDNHARRHGRSNAEHVREPEDSRRLQPPGASHGTAFQMVRRGRGLPSLRRGGDSHGDHHLELAPDHLSLRPDACPSAQHSSRPPRGLGIPQACLPEFRCQPCLGSARKRVRSTTAARKAPAVHHASGGVEATAQGSDREGPILCSDLLASSWHCGGRGLACHSLCEACALGGG
mmetsp:Transcript_97727/g.232706  ORF Transcript_97727/g.232706 Transcript_97727/m.232706 type:complete len:236 (+) Transcript_97727:877-1584(+)